MGQIQMDIKGVAHRVRIGYGMGQIQMDIVLIIQAILILMPYIDKARPRLMSPVAYALINPNF